MTALSLAGKGRVVAEKCATRTTVKVPFPLWLNTLYLNLHKNIVVIFSLNVFRCDAPSMIQFSFK
jgi:hypothetical protein